MQILTSNYIQKAVEKYNVLIEVLNRPKRDMVAIAVVEMIKQSICDFLAAYLAEKGIENMGNDDILALQQACISVDEAFASFNYESIAALIDDENFAFSSELDDEPIQRYVDTLRRTKELVVRSVNRG